MTGKLTLREVLAAAAAASPETQAEQALLRKCALFRAFDRTAFDHVVQATGQTDGPSFEALIARSEVAAVPGKAGWHYIKDDARESFLNEWKADLAGLREFCAAAARFYSRRRVAMDRLAMLTFADPAQALADFTSRYDQADARGDLRTCDELLRLLSNRSSLISAASPELFTFLQNHEQYLRSRVLFVDDWDRSSHYLPRRELTREVKTFLTEDTHWLLQLYAKGGFGKTAFLRWLVSRTLIVDARDGLPRWPVARIDFDRINRANVAAVPGLLLIRAAEQLEQQFAHGATSSVFGTFLYGSQEYSAALQDVGSSGNAGVVVSASDVRAAGFVTDFGLALGARRAVLILDTVEEMVVHRPETWVAILRMLETLHKSCTQLKVIVSGRHDFRAREMFKDWAGEGKGLKTIEVPAFGAPDALRYLTDVRDLVQTFTDEEFVNLPAPAGGNPFKLVLFADLAGAGTRFGLKDLEDLKYVDVHYLIERIIERLPDCELQWTLRYAVVPNQLTREFLEDVLLDPLRQEASNADLDRPKANLPEGAAIVGKSASWSRCAMPFEPEGIWSRLKQYASDSSWIDFVGDVPKLQPELLVPMRYLLQSQPIHAPLHRAAAGHFEKKADGATEATRGAYGVQALYHWFQADGAAAAPQWRRLLDKYSNAQSVREQIAESVFAGSFLDDDGRPLPHQTAGTMIATETLAEAHFEAASALLRRQVSRDVGAVEQHLRQLSDLEGELGHPVIGRERRTLLEARLLVHAGREADAAALIDRTLQAPDIDRRYRVSLLALKGHVLSATDRDAADAAYTEAWTQAKDDPEAFVSAEWIRARQGRLWFDAAHLGKAAAHFEVSVRLLASTVPDPARLLERLQQLIEVLHQGARWSEIPGWIAFARRTLPASTPALAAFIATQSERLNAETLVPPPVSSAWPTDALAILDRAAWLSTVQCPDVVSGYDLARTQFRNAGNTVGAEGCEINKLEYLAGVLGNLTEARTFATKLQPSGPNWLRGQLALMELERQRNPDRAREIWLSIWAQAQTRATVRERAAALAVALAGGVAPAESMAQLTGLLGTVQPPEARTTLVMPFVFAGPGTQQAGPEAAALAHALPSFANDRNFVQRVRRAADALRVAGDRTRAVDWLMAALEHPDGKPPLVRRELLTALQRANGVVADATIDRFLQDVRDQLAGFPEFVLIAHIEQVEWLIEQKRSGHASGVLALAPEPAGEPTLAHCRYFALRAKLASDRETFESWSVRADRIALPLGQPVPFVRPYAWPLPGMAAPVPPSAPRSSAKPAPARAQEALTFAHPAVVITIRRPHEYIVSVRSQTHDGFTASRECRLQDWPNLAAVLHTLGSTQAIEAALGDRQKAAHQLVDVLSLDEIVPMGPTPGVGLLLQIDDDGLAGLPWEWAFDQRGWDFVSRAPEGDLQAETVRWIQAGLVRRGAHLFVDGKAGPQTWTSLRDLDPTFTSEVMFTRRMKQRFNTLLPRNPIGLLCRPYTLERSYRLGYGAFGLDVERLWQGVRGESRRLDPTSLAGGLNTLKPQVLYITLTVTQTGSALRLSFERPGEKGDEAPGPDLTPATLTKALKVLPPEIRPFVILDMPYDGPRAETLSLMYMRNQFAHQLLMLGRVQGVLATGLAGSRSPEVGSTILGSAASPEDAVQLAANLSAITTDVPTSLFASDPTIPLWSDPSSTNADLR